MFLSCLNFSNFICNFEYCDTCEHLNNNLFRAVTELQNGRLLSVHVYRQVVLLPMLDEIVHFSP